MLNCIKIYFLLIILTHSLQADDLEETKHQVNIPSIVQFFRSTFEFWGVIKPINPIRKQAIKKVQIIQSEENLRQNQESSWIYNVFAILPINLISWDWDIFYFEEEDNPDTDIKQVELEKTQTEKTSVIIKDIFNQPLLEENNVNNKKNVKEKIKQSLLYGQKRRKKIKQTEDSTNKPNASIENIVINFQSEDTFSETFITQNNTETIYPHEQTQIIVKKTKDTILSVHAKRFIPILKKVIFADQIIPENSFTQSKNNPVISLSIETSVLSPTIQKAPDSTVIMTYKAYIMRVKEIMNKHKPNKIVLEKTKRFSVFSIQKNTDDCTAETIKRCQDQAKKFIQFGFICHEDCNLNLFYERCHHINAELKKILDEFDIEQATLK